MLFVDDVSLFRGPPAHLSPQIYRQCVQLTLSLGLYFNETNVSRSSNTTAVIRGVPKTVGIEVPSLFRI